MTSKAVQLRHVPREIVREPAWRDMRRLRLCTPAALLPESVLADWLFDPCSLTARLRRACRGRFRVRLLAQRRERPMFDERRLLGLAPGEYALIRQVYLLCDERPCVFARTVIPLSTLTGRHRRLGALGTRPLGAMLFADPTIRREGVQYAHIVPGTRCHREATQDVDDAAGVIWGRRSLFRMQTKRLLVSEIFLPAIGRYR